MLKVDKSSKEIIKTLKDANIEVGNHMSMLTEDGFRILENIFNKKEEVKNQKSTKIEKQQKRNLEVFENNVDKELLKNNKK